MDSRYQYCCHLLNKHTSLQLFSNIQIQNSSQAITDHTKSSLPKDLMVLVFPLLLLSPPPGYRGGTVLVFPLLLSPPPGYRGGITGTLDRAGFMYVRLVPTVRAVAYVTGLRAFLLELRSQSR